MKSEAYQSYKRELALVPLLWGALVGYWAWRIITLTIHFFME